MSSDDTISDTISNEAPAHGPKFTTDTSKPKRQVPKRSGPKEARTAIKVGGAPYKITTAGAEGFREALKATRSAATAITGSASVERQVALWVALDSLRTIAKRERVKLGSLYDACGLRTTDVNKAKRIAESVALIEDRNPSASRTLGVAAVDAVGELSRMLRKAGVSDEDHDRQVDALIEQCMSRARISELRASVKAARVSLKSASTEADAAADDVTPEEVPIVNETPAARMLRENRERLAASQSRGPNVRVTPADDDLIIDDEDEDEAVATPALEKYTSRARSRARHIPKII